ncbi:MAG TPA: DoxX family protein [Candidatus Eisenbacteria bacterium]|nr:DoxX family protein [Candidatus Eisenbacteria bacterium]
MTNPLQQFSPTLYAFLRIVAGFMFALHGAQKLFGAFGAERATDSLKIFAGVVEFGGGILIAIGFLTAPVAFLASGQMAFAYFMAHAPNGFWPIVNRGELAALYCFLFLFVASRGAGPLSVDSMIGKGGKGAAKG